MDQHGGSAPPRPAKPARVHRTPSSPSSLAVSLQRPRPVQDRCLNTYVDTPSPRHQAALLRPPVTQQPKRPSVPVSAGATQQPPPPPRPPDSIICSQCGKCRCAECARPRPLPSRWVGDACLCSAETAIDYVSCMCCTKALFYHCCNDAEGDEAAACADQPCSCSAHRRGARWGCLAALTIALPCLLCYWPLKGAAAVCARAYARAAPSGCRCRPVPPSPTPMTAFLDGPGDKLPLTGPPPRPPR